MSAEVAKCENGGCPLWLFRSGKGSKGKGGVLKPVRAKCLDCSSESWKDVKGCKFQDCPLWPYRFGKRAKAEENTDETGQKPKTRTGEGLRRWREKQKGLL